MIAPPMAINRNGDIVSATLAAVGPAIELVIYCAWCHHGRTFAVSSFPAPLPDGWDHIDDRPRCPQCRRKHGAVAPSVS